MHVNSFNGQLAQHPAYYKEACSCIPSMNRVEKFSTLESHALRQADPCINTFTYTIVAKCILPRLDMVCLLSF